MHMSTFLMGVLFFFKTRFLEWVVVHQILRKRPEAEEKRNIVGGHLQVAHQIADLTAVRNQEESQDQGLEIFSLTHIHMKRGKQMKSCWELDMFINVVLNYLANLVHILILSSAGLKKWHVNCKMNSRYWHKETGCSSSGAHSLLLCGCSTPSMQTWGCGRGNEIIVEMKVVTGSTLYRVPTGICTMLHLFWKKM